MIEQFLTWYLKLEVLYRALIEACAFWTLVIILFSLVYYYINKRTEKYDEIRELQEKIGRTE